MQFQTHLSRSSSSRFTTSSRPHLTQTPRLRPLTSPMHSLSIPGSSISSSSMAAEQQKQRRGSLVTARWGASAVVLGLSLLVSLPWEQLDHHFPYEKVEVPDVGPQDRPRFTRSVIHIPSHGDRLEAWLYLPKDSQQPPPIVVMGHGMGAQKDIGLWMYGERFCEAGMAVLVFDYRGFGGSEGMPRHWVSPRRHLQDFEAVIQHVQATNLDGAVDGSRVALWGVSYGGAHALVTAADFGSSISAVVANEPYVSPEAVLSTTMVRGIGRTLRLLGVGICDELRRLLSHVGFNLPPVYLRLVAPMNDPKALALLLLKDSEMAIRSNAQPPVRQGNWQNKVLARVVLEALGYNPSKHLPRITAPIFFRVGLKDHLCPPEILHAALDRAGLPESQYVIQARDVTHLEAHATGVKEEWITPVIAFLRRHLGLATPEELVEPAAAVAGAHEGGQPKEGLEPAVQYVRSADPHSQATSGPGEKGQQEEPVAEVQFPSMD